jgi:uncharacterized GH25 family protein
MAAKTFKQASARSFLVVVAYTGFFSLTSPHAHELIVKPAQFSAQPESKIAFSVLASHLFMVSDAMEPLDRVTSWLHEEGKQTAIKLRENPRMKSLDGEALLSTKGTAILVSYLQEPVETRPTQDGRPGTKIKREKWSKALLSGSAPDKGYEKILGHKLEIVPLANPLSLKVGNELSVKILLNGKPLNTMIYATYDGFSRHDYTFAYATEAKNGVAHIKFTQPGIWMVRVENRQQVAHKDFNQHVLKATLIFPIQ